LDKNDACIKEENNTDIKVEDEKKLINLNNALKEELMNIPGIGESKAKSIIEYRNKNKFITIEDIKNVSGIGDSVFEKIKGYITI
jgi:competence protein ComEA